jgi:hypothetical protein
MKTFTELGTVYRGDPCLEYPGEWLVFYPWRKQESADVLASFEQALSHARKVLDQAEEDKREYDPRDVTICWKCSDNDPRVGQVWFTGFYQHGKFNLFGDYKT